MNYTVVLTRCISSDIRIVIICLAYQFFSRAVDAESKEQGALLMKSFHHGAAQSVVGRYARYNEVRNQTLKTTMKLPIIRARKLHHFTMAQLRI